MAKHKGYDWIWFGLLIIGGLNWGLLGIFNYNLVGALLGTGLWAHTIYGAVGISAIVTLFRLIMH